LRSEPATADVPVILRGQSDDPKSRVWAGRARAPAYVVKGRLGALVRALVKAIASSPSSDGFFMQLSGGNRDIRDRIAQHLDAALFESVIAAEVRALACEGSFDRLFDLLCQLLSQLTSYRWLAVATRAPAHFGIHHHPKLGDKAVAEARQVLGVDAESLVARVEDEDALLADTSAPAIVCAVKLGETEVGSIALSVATDGESDATSLLPLVARELGGPLRMAALVEESRLQASTDSLTGMMNRRAFLKAMENEMARCERYDYPLSVILFDVDHFKHINDRRGHAAGDHVLTHIGSLLRGALRGSDFGVRWGGEEFVLALTSTGLEGGRIVAERLRVAVEQLDVRDASGVRIPITASVGLASLRAGESFHMLVSRADKAMYAAKTGGRNKIVVDEDNFPQPALTSSANGPS
jgi:two-component system cell cycle response regulator